MPAQKTIREEAQEYDDRHDRLRHAQQTGIWLTYPPAVIDEYPTFTSAFDARCRNRKMLMKSKQELEHKDNHGSE